MKKNMTREEIKAERDEHFANMGQAQDNQYLLMNEAQRDVCNCTTPEQMISVFQFYMESFSNCRKYYNNEVKEWMHYYKEYETITESGLDLCISA